MTAADVDAAYMTAALALGRRNMGRAAPNPAVGALVVREGVVVGRGFTGIGGRPHAETMALAQAGDAARRATLYVTLEPCSHHGETPPCVDAIIANGLARVVTAMDDPDPRVAGRGHTLLREAGIEVLPHVLERSARRDHIGHTLRVTEGRPMVTLKLAQTPDGFAAGALHDPRLHITGPLADAYTHMQRSLHDAIMIGVGAAREDDPLMTIRLPGMEDEKRLRVVLELASFPVARVSSWRHRETDSNARDCGAGRRFQFNRQFHGRDRSRSRARAHGYAWTHRTRCCIGASGAKGRYKSLFRRWAARRRNPDNGRARPRGDLA